MTTQRKPELIDWLERETGKSLDASAAASANDRHVSVRLPTALYERLDAIARSHQETVSQSIRRLVGEALDHIDHPDVAALDTAISALQNLRQRSA